MAEGNELSARTKRLRGLRERTIDDVPEADGLRAFENARPNRPEPVSRTERVRGPRED